MKLYNENSTVEWQFFSLNFYSDTQKHFVIGLLYDDIWMKKELISRKHLALICIVQTAVLSSSNFFYQMKIHVDSKNALNILDLLSI